jgi:HSP20 family protein
MRYHDLLELQEEMNRLFREARRWEGAAPEGPGLDVPVDIAAAEQEYRVRLDLPGVPRDRLRVQVEDRTLTVSGAKEPGAEPGRKLRGEREFGGFSRAIALPSDADLANLAARLTDGVLEVRVGRRGPQTPRRIPVEVAEG